MSQGCNALARTVCNPAGGRGEDSLVISHRRAVKVARENPFARTDFEDERSLRPLGLVVRRR